jgi:PPK2 family polyphosphate:nucleotide phosphotransferase
VEPGRPFDLASVDPADVSRAPGGKRPTVAATDALAERLADLQEVLWARQRERVLIVLQGMDTSGKGGTIEHVFGAVNPVGLKIVSFKAPSELERSRDYLWRIHAEVPGDGELTIFDRSHYEDVIAVRVRGLAPEVRWRRRFDHIVAFERLLVDEGTTIVKVLLHISKDEQKRRLEARLEQAHKHWKFNKDDLVAREQWTEYQVAFQEAIEATAAPHAPWYVVPADEKWYRNWAIATIVTGVLEHLDLTWPEAAEDLSDIVID